MYLGETSPGINHLFYRYLELEDPLADEVWFNQFLHMSCGAEKSDQVRLWGVIYPYRIAYIAVNVADFSDTSKVTFDESSTWTNITSNVVEHPTYNMIAYGVNRTNFGGAKFRNRAFGNLGELEMYEPYT